MSQQKKANDEVVWSGIEPSKGRAVTLYAKERNHIVNNHPVMSDQIHAVWKSVEQPDAVYSSSLSYSREVSFSKNCGFKHPKLFVKTIVEYNGNEGKIITSFPTLAEKGGIDVKIYEKK